MDQACVMLAAAEARHETFGLRQEFCAACIYSPNFYEPAACSFLSTLVSYAWWAGNLMRACLHVSGSAKAGGQRTFLPNLFTKCQAFRW